MVDAIASAQACATEHESSPAATVEKRLAPWVSLTKAGAERISGLLVGALADGPCDRADSLLYLLKKSDDSVLWDDGMPYAAGMLHGAAACLRVAGPSAGMDLATAVRPTALNLLEELTGALEEFTHFNSLDRLAAFSNWTPGAKAEQPVNDPADQAVSDDLADVFQTIARHASDIETLIEMSQDHQLQDYRRDAAMTAAGGLAQLIGAITCVARGGQHASEVTMSAWLMRGAA
jgi:hypothetical protein